MKDELDVLLDLAAETEVTNGKGSFADVDLSSPESEDEEEQPTTAPLPTDEKEKKLAAGEARGGVVEASSSVKIMSTLRNTSWEKENGNEDATEVRERDRLLCFLVCFFCGWGYPVPSLHTPPRDTRSPPPPQHTLQLQIFPNTVVDK